MDTLKKKLMKRRTEIGKSAKKGAVVEYFGGTLGDNFQVKVVPMRVSAAPFRRSVFLSVPGSCFHRFWATFGGGLVRFWAHFRVKVRKGKTVFRLRRRVRIAYPTFQKTTLLGDFTSHFLVFFPGGVFSHFLGAAAAKVSNMAPKRVRGLKHLGSLFQNLLPLGGTGAQNDCPGPSNRAPEPPKGAKKSEKCSKWTQI